MQADQYALLACASKGSCSLMQCGTQRLLHTLKQCTPCTNGLCAGEAGVVAVDKVACERLRYPSGAMCVSESSPDA